MSRPIEALIDKHALQHNIALLREKAGKRFMWSVVKADAYGHGLHGLLDTFELTDGLALLDVDEAVAVRNLGWKKPVLLIEGFFTYDDLPKVDRYGIETLVHSDWQIEDLKKFSFENKVRVHIKLNSGMNRLGFLPARAKAVKEELEKIPMVEVVDFVTHFANSELTYPADGKLPVSGQLNNLVSLEGLACDKCFSNSGAILWHPEAADGAVRAGIALYGVSPDGNKTSGELGLVPVMTLRAGILGTQNLQPGDAVGYGSKFVAKHPMRIAVLACGYADGYPRQKLEDRFVLIHGKKAPLVGSVSMDMITVDITDIPEAKPGDWAELWGKNLPVNEVAALHGTIGYELLANLNIRVKREFIS
ncbi:alanine racemase [Turicimonas sp. TL08]